MRDGLPFGNARHVPNILFVLCDQLTASLTGAYGHRVVKTPTLERLAAEGIRFDAAYSPCPLCASARASLMTGRYASEIDCFDNASPLSCGEPTFAHLLAVAGYQTALSGKMHFVGPDQLHGFARRLTTDIYPSDFAWVPKRVEGGRFERGGHAAEYTLANVGVRPWSAGLRFDEETHARALEYLRDRGAERRVEGASSAPFLLCVSYHHPHEPFHVTQELWDLYEGEPIELPELPADLESRYSTMDRWLNALHGLERIDIRAPESLTALRRSYYGLVTYIDRKLGELLNMLDEQGLGEDTVVVFASDHGDMLGEKGMVQKRCFYEWSARVPLIIRLPNRSRAGERIRTAVSLVDLLPTLAGLAGIGLPSDAGWAGADLLRIAPADPDRIVFSEYHTQGVLAPCFMARRGAHKYIYVHGHGEQLFDLQTDPGESHNLAGSPAHARTLAALRAAVLQRFDPESIHARAQRSVARRTLVRDAMRANGTHWDYAPPYDARAHYTR